MSVEQPSTGEESFLFKHKWINPAFTCWVLLEESPFQWSFPVNQPVFAGSLCFSVLFFPSSTFLFSHLHFIFLLYCSCLNFKTCTGDHLYVNIHTALTNKCVFIYELIYVKSFKEDNCCSLFSSSGCSVKMFLILKVSVSIFNSCTCKPQVTDKGHKKELFIFWYILL